MRFSYVLALLFLLLSLSDSDAGPFRHCRGRRAQSDGGSVCWASVDVRSEPAAAVDAGASVSAEPGVGAELDALAEVNAARKARGLRPFIHDPDLTAAALVCAKLRAKHRIAGHTGNDFAALRRGVRASAAGCAAWAPSWGWGSCCTYEGYRYAGAAVVVGADGVRYMHLFVR